MIDPDIEFFLIRHGETNWNREGRLQGQRDIPLNARGREQAAAAGRALKRELVARGVDPACLDFVASPLGRTRETMGLARASMGLPVTDYRLDPILQELSFGDWEGLTWPEVKALAPALVRRRKLDKWSFVPPGGESYADLCERVRPWVHAVKHHDVVVAHGGVARVLMHLLGGATTTHAPNLDIWQGRVLRFFRHRWTWH